MAFESTKVTIKQKKLLTNTKVEFAKELDLMESIDKIVSISGMSRILGKDMIDGKLEIRGKTKFDILAVCDNELKTFVQDVDWNKTLDAVVFGNVLISINNTKFVEENLTFVKGVVDFDVYGETMDIIPGVRAEDEILIKEQTMDVLSLIGSNSNSFTITHEFEEKSIKEILSKNARVTSYVATSGVDAYSVEGEIEVSLLVKNEEEIYEIKKSIDFKQEMPFTGMLPTNILYNNLNVVTLMCSVTESEEKSVLLIAIDVDDNVSAYETLTINTLQDAYSITNMLVTSQECLSVVSNQDKNVISTPVSFGIKVEDRLLQEVLGVPVATVKSVVKNENGFNCIVEYNVVYRDEEGVILNKKGEELINVAIENVNECSILNTSVLLESCKMKFGNEIELLLSIKFEILREKLEYVTFVTEIEKGEEYSEENPSIAVYVVNEGEDLFDVGKALRVSIDKLKAQNENIDSLSVGQKIIVYNKLEYNA